MPKTQFVILLSLLLVIGGAWAYLIYQYWQMVSLPMSEMWMPPSDASAWKLVDFGLLYLMWAAMMAAMMLPSAIPMILAFSGIAKRHCRRLKNSVFFLSTATWVYGSPSVSGWRLAMAAPRAACDISHDGFGKRVALRSDFSRGRNISVDASEK